MHLSNALAWISILLETLESVSRPILCKTGQSIMLSVDVLVRAGKDNSYRKGFDSKMRSPCSEDIVSSKGSSSFAN